MKTIEFTLKTGKYVALLENGVTIPVLTASETARFAAMDVAAAFCDITEPHRQRQSDGYLLWPEVSRARLSLGLTPRVLGFE